MDNDHIERRIAESARQAASVVAPAPDTNLKRYPHGGPGRLIVPPGTPISQWVCSLPTTTEDGRDLLFNSQSQPDLTMDKGSGDIPFTIRHFVAGWQESPDDHGEVHSYSWLVLTDPEGRTLGTSSPIIAHRVAALMDLYPDFPGGRDVDVVLRWRISKRARRQYQELRRPTTAPIPHQDLSDNDALDIDSAAREGT